MAVASAHLSLINRVSLPLPMPYVVPDGELETLIATIFSEVLNLDHVGANDEFFDLGGDSLLAEVLSMVLSERTGHDVPLSSLAEYGSPRRIAASLKPKASHAVASLAAPRERIRPPIFVVHGRYGFTLLRPAFYQALAENRRVHTFELPGIRGGRQYDQIEDIAAVYVAQLVTDYPKGPVFLAALCMGVLIALEMTAQLAARGRPVRHLVLLDPNAPKEIMTEEDPIMTPAEDWRPTIFRDLRHLLMGWMDEQKFRHEILRKKHHVKYKAYRLSITAQTKLLSAYRRYRPRPFSGPVTVISSAKRVSAFQDDSPFWNRILPHRTMHMMTERHTDLSNGATARFIQSICDDALAVPGPSIGIRRAAGF